MVSPDHVKFWAKSITLFIFFLGWSLRMLCAYMTDVLNTEVFIMPQNIAFVHLQVVPCTLHTFVPARLLRLLFCYKIQ